MIPLWKGVVYYKSIGQFICFCSATAVTKSAPENHFTEVVEDLQELTAPGL